MKFPYSMLLDFVETRLTAEEAGDLLTMAGFELEGIEEVEGEPVLDIKVTSNRGDGLSVFGLSREVLAKDSAAKPTPLYGDAVDRFSGAEARLSYTAAEGDSAPVEVQTPSCTRYACRLFDVNGAPTPEWMQKRLRQAGQRPISLLVDLTNYVMLELGQPLHAFDYDKLAGGRIVVRQAKPSEKMTTLDGLEHELTPENMMICDADRPVAVAGVMGGLETEVSASTKRMLLESAHFASSSIRRTRRQLGMSTEASYRFERSVDPEGVVGAIRRFSMLLAEVPNAATIHQSITDVYPHPVLLEPIRLRISRTETLLGMAVEVEQARGYLERLGFKICGGSAAEFEVLPPTWRPDIEREDDLIEEIGRVHGYERIPEALPRGSTTQGGSFGYEAFVDRACQGAVRAGFAQTISHSLGGRDPLDDPARNMIGPRGITDPDMMWLRNSLLPSLAKAARVNGARDVHLFEIGAVFGESASGASEQRNSIAFLSQGALNPPDWSEKHVEKTSFFSLKAAVEQVVGECEFHTPETPDPRFHPTRQARILKLDGVVGQIHPDVAQASGLPEDTVLAEVDLNAAYEHGGDALRFHPISKNPAVRRDIAVLVDKSVPYAKIEKAVSSSAGGVLERQWLFDVYEGQGVPEGKHSLAIALQLRKMGENFTDEEANQVRERVVAALAELGATPR